MFTRALVIVSLLVCLWPATLHAQEEEQPEAPSVTPEPPPRANEPELSLPPSADEAPPPPPRLQPSETAPPTEAPSRPAPSTEASSDGAPRAAEKEKKAEKEEDDDDEPRKPGDVRVSLVTEFGFFNVLHNTLQQDSNGTDIDLAGEGGQELFYPFLRLSAELLLSQRHAVILLYQPIDLETQVTTPRDWDIDELRFPQGTPTNIRYGFDFFRLSYLYDLAPSEDWEIGVGGGFQMRIATNVFTSADGTLRRDSRNLGPVPLLKARLRAPLGERSWFGAELDGFYAAFTVANGSTESDVTGAIVDGSVRMGQTLWPGLDGYLNLRYLGGGATGTSTSDAEENPGDGFTKNWIHTLSLSVGFRFEPVVALGAIDD